MSIRQYADARRYERLVCMHAVNCVCVCWPRFERPVSTFTDIGCLNMDEAGNFYDYNNKYVIN